MSKRKIALGTQLWLAMAAKFGKSPRQTRSHLRDTTEDDEADEEVEDKGARGDCSAYSSVAVTTIALLGMRSSAAKIKQDRERVLLS